MTYTSKDVLLLGGGIQHISHNYTAVHVWK